MVNLNDVLDEYDHYINDVTMENNTIVADEYESIEFNECNFNTVCLSGAKFCRTSFYNCTFDHCDFSNVDFKDCYFKQVTITSSKCVGTLFDQCIFKEGSIQDNRMHYCSFNACKIENSLVKLNDLSNGALCKTQFKTSKIDENNFTGVDFTNAFMKGLKFSNSLLQSIICSNDFKEFKGCKLSMFQAALMMQSLGVIIDDL